MQLEQAAIHGWFSMLFRFIWWSRVTAPTKYLARSHYFLCTRLVWQMTQPPTGTTYSTSEPSSERYSWMATQYCLRPTVFWDEMTTQLLVSRCEWRSNKTAVPQVVPSFCERHHKAFIKACSHVFLNVLSDVTSCVVYVRYNGDRTGKSAGTRSTAGWADDAVADWPVCSARRRDRLPGAHRCVTQCRLRARLIARHNYASAG